MPSDCDCLEVHSAILCYNLGQDCLHENWVMTTPKPDHIWRLQAQLDIKGLVMALKDPSPATRKRAAAALRTVGAVQALVALKYVVSLETDPDARLSMLSAIDALENISEVESDTLPEPSAVDRLAVELDGSDITIAMKAARTMATLADKTAVVPLILKFNDPLTPIHLRLTIAEALLNLESAPGEVALLANLRHQDWEIRRNGAAILGQLRAEWAIEPLGQALSDPHPTVRKTALAALKYIGTPDARKVVARFATGLQRRGTSDSSPGLAATVSSDPTLTQPQRSRLLDKPVPSAQLPVVLPEGIQVIRVSDQQKKAEDARQNDVSTSILDTSTVNDYEQRRDAENQPND